MGPGAQSPPWSPPGVAAPHRGSFPCSETRGVPCEAPLLWGAHPSPGVLEDIFVWHPAPGWHVGFQVCLPGARDLELVSWTSEWVGACVDGCTDGRRCIRPHPKGGRSLPRLQAERCSSPSLSPASGFLTRKAGPGAGPGLRGWLGKAQTPGVGPLPRGPPRSSGARTVRRRSESGARSCAGVFPALPPAKPAPGCPNSVPGQATSGRAPGGRGEGKE